MASPEVPEDRERVRRLLLAHPWKSATSKRYKRLPHQYSLRRRWPNDADFCWVVEYIRRIGYQKFFIGRTWTYYDIGEYQYWDCGGELHPTGTQVKVEGINRAVRRPTACLLPLETTMATTVKVDIQAILDKLSRGEVTLAEARAAFQAWLCG